MRSTSGRGRGAALGDRRGVANMTNIPGLAHSGTPRNISSLPANQQKALPALLTTTTIEAAAAQCGVGVRTVKGYLAQENFAAVYREQRELLLQETFASLTRLGSKALTVIDGALDDGNNPNARLRAARIVRQPLDVACWVSRVPCGTTQPPFEDAHREVRAPPFQSRPVRCNRQLDRGPSRGRTLFGLLRRQSYAR
jgi:hypothetical protein